MAAGVFRQKKGSTETQKTSPSLFPHCGSCYETFPNEAKLKLFGNFEKRALDELTKNGVKYNLRILVPSWQIATLCHSMGLILCSNATLTLSHVYLSNPLKALVNFIVREVPVAAIEATVKG